MDWVRRLWGIGGGREHRWVNRQVKEVVGCKVFGLLYFVRKNGFLKVDVARGDNLS